MFKKPNFGKRKPETEKMVALNFEKVADTYADLNYKLFTSFGGTGEQIYEKIDENTIYFGSYIAELWRDDDFDLNNMVKKSDYSEDYVVNSSAFGKKTCSVLIKKYRKNDLFYCEFGAINRSLMEKFIFKVAIDDDFFANSISTIYSLFFDDARSYGSIDNVIDECLFTITRDDVQRMGLLEHQFYLSADKNEAGDMIIFERDSK